MTGETMINSPGLWLADFVKPSREGHKYDRGHAVIYAAPELTGATRLAAEACSRIGTGLVTVLAAERADVYRTVLAPDIMVRSCAIADLNKPTTILVGSGGMPSTALKDIGAGVNLNGIVLDAGAVRHAQDLQGVASHTILTPHEGEFSKAFPDLTGSREERARQAATELGVTIILKGSQTLITNPNGGQVLNTHATPYLAKAGTGDVLSGFVTGLVAQGMDPFQASCAAVWIHGEAAKRVGPGLVASDLQALVPGVLADLNIH